MTTMTATIKNAAGIHCRPSTVIVKALLDYRGTISISSDLAVCDLRSVMELMVLALRKGDTVSISVEGPDEENTCRKIVDLFETNFDFPPEKDGTPATPDTRT